MLDPGGEGGRQGVALVGTGGDADVLGAHPRRKLFRAAESVHVVVDGVAVAAEKRGREGHADLRLTAPAPRPGRPVPPRRLPDLGGSIFGRPEA